MLRIATFMIGLLLTTGAVAAAAPPTPPIGLGSGLGCGAQCIKKALVTPTMTGGSLEVKTDTSARIKIWVSDQAPGSIDGKPWVPNPDDYLETWNYYLSHTFSLDSLTAGTLYHIVVSATDHQGRTAYRVGTFRTVKPPPLPPAAHHEERTVRVTLWKIEIQNDADHDCCITANRGEIRFDHFVNGTRMYRNGEQKLGTGSSFNPLHPSSPITLANPPRYLALRIVGRERDPGVSTAFDSSGNGAAQGCSSYDTGSVSWDISCAHKALDLDNLRDDVIAGDYGGMPFGHDAYVVFESPGENYLEFRVYAYIDVSSA